MFLAVVAICFVACNNSERRYSKTANGLYYWLENCSHDGQVANNQDYLIVDMAYYFRDSLYYDSKQAGENPRIQLQPSKFKGDLYEGLAMLREGDSASFLVDADSTFITMFNYKYPDSLLEIDEKLRFEIKVNRILTSQQWEEENRIKDSIATNSSLLLFQEYIDRYGITEAPDDNGIVCKVTKQGNGRLPRIGDIVELCYVGRLMNGMVFDSIPPHRPLLVTLGSKTLIPGLESALYKMRKGEQAKVLIPFYQAFGEHGYNMIPPYANLVYDVMILDISTRDEAEKKREQRKAEAKKKADKEFIEYLNDNKINTKPSPMGIYKVVEREGEGALALNGDNVKITFVALHFDGTILSTSEDLGDDGYYATLDGATLLPALEESIMTMKVGEKSVFIMPYYAAYGDRDLPSIPAFSNLIFVVELLEIN